jgi:predicted DNA-binding protein with PD1-like motif
MKTKRIEGGATRTLVVVFDKDEELIDGLQRLAEDEHLDSAHFTAIGGFSSVVLAFFSREKLAYEDIPVNEQVEVLSLEGNIVPEDAGFKVHAHVVVGRRDGSTRGGHVQKARIWPTLEVVLEEAPLHLRRKIDRETGLALIS